MYKNIIKFIKRAKYTIANVNENNDSEKSFLVKKNKIIYIVKIE